MNHSKPTTPPLTTTQEPWLAYFTTGKFMKDKMFLIVAGTALSSIVAYGAYRKIFGQKTPVVLSKADTIERAKKFINSELERLRDPQLIDDEMDGYLQKKDFFDLLALIQLKSKMKLTREVGKNQRERVKILQFALSQTSNSEDCLVAFQQYVQKTTDIMQRECDLYEKEFQKILSLVGISNDTWEASREIYISGQEVQPTEEGDPNTSQTPDGLNIDSIDKRIYEYLPQPILPSSLTRDRLKTLMLDTNSRAAFLFRTYMRDYVLDNCNPEFEPLITETLTYDLTQAEYGFGEGVLRYATHRYELNKDPEVKEYLDEYLSN